MNSKLPSECGTWESINHRIMNHHMAWHLLFSDHNKFPRFVFFYICNLVIGDLTLVKFLVIVYIGVERLRRTNLKTKTFSISLETYRCTGNCDLTGSYLKCPEYMGSRYCFVLWPIWLHHPRGCHKQQGSMHFSAHHVRLMSSSDLFNPDLGPARPRHHFKNTETLLVLGL